MLSPPVTQVELGDETLEALQRRKGAPRELDLGLQGTSSRSLAPTTPSVRHTWWGGVNEEDAERLWMPSPQASQRNVNSASPRVRAQ